MMLTLTSERPSLAVEVDGEVRKLPVTLNRAELASMMKTKAGGAARPEEFMEWFYSFARRYLGDVVDECGDDALSSLIREWSAEREKVGEPGLGES